MIAHQFTMQIGPTPGKIIPLQNPEISIGRELSNDIIISDADVSRRHARLLRQGDSYVLEDLNSTNGTYVNGLRLDAPQQLQPADQVKLGEAVMLVYESFAFNGEPIHLEQPAAVKPEPVVAQPEQIATEPEPVVAQPEQIAMEPEPVAAGPEPAEFPRGETALEQFPLPKPVKTAPEVQEDLPPLPPLNAAQPSRLASNLLKSVRQAAAQNAPVVTPPEVVVPVVKAPPADAPPPASGELPVPGALPAGGAPVVSYLKRIPQLWLLIGGAALILLCICVVIALIIALTA